MRTSYFAPLRRWVSRLGHGSWGFDPTMWSDLEQTEARAALTLALRQGVDFLDTAAVYGNGRAELEIGRVLAELRLRHDVLVATKVPPAVPIWIPSPHIHASEAFPGHYIRRHTEASLERLGVECLALQQLHTWAPTWLGQGDWEETLDRLRAEGKIAGWGISLHDHDADAGIPAVREGAVHAVQVSFSLFDQGAARGLLPAAHAAGAFVIARSTLYAGALTGSFTPHTIFPEGDWRRDFFDQDHLSEVVARVRRLHADMGADDRSVADLAMRFVLSEPGISTAVVGMRRRRHVYTNLRVADGAPIPPERMHVLRRHDWLS